VSHSAGQRTRRKQESQGLDWHQNLGPIWSRWLCYLGQNLSFSLPYFLNPYHKRNEFSFKFYSYEFDEFSCTLLFHLFFIAAECPHIFCQLLPKVSFVLSLWILKSIRYCVCVCKCGGVGWWGEGERQSGLATERQGKSSHFEFLKPGRLLKACGELLKGTFVGHIASSHFRSINNCF
jgi:hypothetical protein